MNKASLIQYIRDPSSLEAKDLPMVLGEVERLRAELWSALCAAAATPGATKATPSEAGFLTAAEVATRLKFSRGHVYELVRRGSLRVVRTGRSVRVPIDALHDLSTIGVARAIDLPDHSAISSRRRGRGQTPPTSVDTEAGISETSPSSSSGRRRKGAGTSRPIQSSTKSRRPKVPARPKF